MADESGGRIGWVLSKDTLMPIGTVIVLVGVIVSTVISHQRLGFAVETLSSKVGRSERELRDDIKDLSSKVDQLTRDYLTVRDFQLWLKVFAAENADVSVPEFEDDSG